jgi:hypothetical protein
MAAVAEPSDWDDPCQVATWLKPQLAKVLAGRQTLMVQHDGVTVQYSQGRSDALLAFYRMQVDECQKQTSGSSGRRAFIGG